MHWADVDLQTGWWTIPAEVAKNGRAHRVPLTDPGMAIVKTIRQSHSDPDWVFPSPTRKGQPISEIQKAFQRARTSSGIEDFVAHDLRRTAATGTRRDGVSHEDVGRVLNHAVTDVTGRYDRYDCDPEKRHALEVWAKHLAKIIDF